MLAKTLGEIDRFYPILAVTLIVLSALTIFTFKGIFSALKTAGKVDEQIVGVQIQLDKAKLDQAYKEGVEKKESLDLGQ